MKRDIHDLAMVSPSAWLGEGTRIGAFAIVGDDVELGDRCIVEPYAIIQGPSSFGKENHFYSHSVVGNDPQDLKFAGEKTRLEAGDANQFREFCTVSRGTSLGGGVTRLGNHNLIMSYAHIAHDCRVGSYTILVNAATLGGHVTVEDYAQVGAFCPVHQFCRIGKFAYVAAHTVVTQDVAPFSKVVAPRGTKTYGVNSVGLARAGFSPERIHAIEKAFRLLLHSKLNTTQALVKMRETLAGSEDVTELVRFIETAARGLAK